MIIKRNLTSFTRVLYSTATKSGGQSGSASSSNKKKTSNKTTSSPPQPPPSQQTFKAAVEPEEPFRNDQYNCPEYYQHDRFSFFDLIDRMADKRLPQKTNKEMYR
ncbi:hypothetical protein HUG17_6411 [Dermatophagoides farinae]|uniref:NADH dehydrogenase [ubiquinone] flavoprotein 3, mitochondrial n=1 Tax=Dermatophagoides farinae TaxID=6954 RepID=A0A9D4SIS5_DERFA|nr:uncharacterized protein LOC124493927 [Dermatophagoides farinae]KAH7644049.1 hypothetical protein HUG17_6411 [Dermatophagoides farinae]